LALGKEVAKTFNEAKQKIPFKLRSLEVRTNRVFHGFGQAKFAYGGSI